MKLEDILRNKDKEFCILKADFIVEKNLNKNLEEYIKMGCDKCLGYNKECGWYFSRKEYDRSHGC